MCCKNKYILCCIDNFILMIFILLIMLVIMYIKILNSKIISFIFFVCILLLILTSYRLIEYGFPENCKNCLKKTNEDEN